MHHRTYSNQWWRYMSSCFIILFITVLWVLCFVVEYFFTVLKLSKMLTFVCSIISFIMLPQNNDLSYPSRKSQQPTEVHPTCFVLCVTQSFVAVMVIIFLLEFSWNLTMNIREKLTHYVETVWTRARNTIIFITDKCCHSLRVLVCREINRAVSGDQTVNSTPVEVI